MGYQFRYLHIYINAYSYCLCSELACYLWNPSLLYSQHMVCRVPHTHKHTHTDMHCVICITISQKTMIGEPCVVMYTFCFAQLFCKSSSCISVLQNIFYQFRPAIKIIIIICLESVVQNLDLHSQMSHLRAWQVIYGDLVTVGRGVVFLLTFFFFTLNKLRFMITDETGTD